MGELDLVTVCFTYDPGISGAQAAFRTVLVTWAPLALAGIAIGRSPRVHATMRGAGPLRLLARLGIAVLLAAIVLSPMVAAIVVGTVWRGDGPPFGVALVAVACTMAPVGTLGAAGIAGWHRVLVALASREGDGRMLV